MRKFRQQIINFWQRYPALHLGLCLTWGSGAFIQWSWALLVPLCILLMGGFRSFLFILFAFFYTFWHYPTLHSPLEGTAEFHIESLKIQSSPFYKSYAYRGTVKTFTTPDSRVSKNLPCTILVPLKKQRPLANQDYRIEGALQKKGNHTYILKPTKGDEWKKIDPSWSLAEWRFQAKEKTKKFLKKQIPNEKSAIFLAALLTGDIDERTLILDFNKVGIQHILAISGFHFALIAAFLGFFLRLFLNPKATSIVLFILLTTYFFFVGNAPSVLRAWIAISLILAGQFLKLRTFGLNILGCALIVEILCNPLLVTNIGFQLSFLATAAILLLYPIFEQLSYRLLPKWPLDKVILMSSWHQHLYVIGAALRKLLSLNIAVHVATIPLLLFLFKKFPLLSLGYNLFFPLGTTLSLCLFCTASLIFFLFPPFGTLLYQLSSKFTAMLLISVEHPSTFLDYSLRFSFPLPLLLIFLSSLFLSGIIYNTRTKYI